MSIHILGVIISTALSAGQQVLTCPAVSRTRKYDIHMTGVYGVYGCAEVMWKRCL